MKKIIKCKDCKFCVIDKLDKNKEYPICTCTKNPIKINPYNGDIKLKWTYCNILREDIWFLSLLLGTCGFRARYFVKKQGAKKK